MPFDFSKLESTLPTNLISKHISALQAGMKVGLSNNQIITATVNMPEEALIHAGIRTYYSREYFDKLAEIPVESRARDIPWYPQPRLTKDERRIIEEQRKALIETHWMLTDYELHKEIYAEVIRFGPGATDADYFLTPFYEGERSIISNGEDTGLTETHPLHQVYQQFEGIENLALLTHKQIQTAYEKALGRENAGAPICQLIRSLLLHHYTGAEDVMIQEIPIWRTAYAMRDSLVHTINYPLYELWMNHKSTEASARELEDQFKITIEGHFDWLYFVLFQSLESNAVITTLQNEFPHSWRFIEHHFIGDE